MHALKISMAIGGSMHFCSCGRLLANVSGSSCNVLYFTLLACSLQACYRTNSRCGQC